MLDFLIWLVAGAVVGGVAAMLMRDDDDQSVFVNVLVGIGGALGAGWLVAPYFQVKLASSQAFGFGALAIALVGAVALLALVGLVRRGRKA